MFFDQKYAQLCSEKTLQANKEGFFLQFANTVAKEVGEKWIKNFGELQTDKQRIKHIYEDDKIKHIVIEFLTNVQEIYRKKCPQAAKERLLQAELFLKNGEKKKALTLFSQSILKAPKEDASLSLALIGRAKILISLNEYSSALTDLQLYLKEKIPNNRKFEAFWMMAICYKALNETSKSQISLNLAEKLAGNNKELLAMIRHSMQTNYEPIKKPEKKLPSIISDRHSQLSNASKKLSVVLSQDVGRYTIAAENVKVGETLIVEPPTVACLFPEKFGTHCHHCFERFLAPIGCPDCASVAFCGPTCRDSAISTYHKYECKFLDLLIGSGMSVLSLAALRSITQRNFGESLEIYKNQNGDGLFGLCTNASKRENEDFLQRSLMAALLLRCLQKSGYFKGNDDAVVPSDEEYHIGEMLLYHLQVLQFNAHEISETLYSSDHNLKGGRLASIGIAVYPTVALLNHECNPSVTRHFVGKHIVITAIRSLLPGQAISENYGPIFTLCKLMDRQRCLSGRYWFNCQCIACLENWPVLNNVSDFINRVRCPTIDCSCLFELPVDVNSYVNCPKCKENVCLEKNIQQLRWCVEQYEAASKFVENKKIEKAIKVLCEALDIFYRVSAPPHRETHLAEKALRACLADFGNTCECLIKIEK